jgi:hypothetical protein
VIYLYMDRLDHALSRSRRGKARVATHGEAATPGGTARGDFTRPAE